jgi:hypothetical protein
MTLVAPWTAHARMPRSSQLGPRQSEEGARCKAGTSGSYTFFGSLPGTFTLVVQRPDGVNLAVLFNQRTDPSGLSYEDIEKVLNKAADGVKVWPL